MWLAAGSVEEVKKKGGTFDVVIGPDFEAVNPVEISAITKDATANLNTAADDYCAS